LHKGYSMGGPCALHTGYSREDPVPCTKDTVGRPLCLAQRIQYGRTLCLAHRIQYGKTLCLAQRIQYGRTLCLAQRIQYGRTLCLAHRIQYGRTLCLAHRIQYGRTLCLAQRIQYGRTLCLAQRIQYVQLCLLAKALYLAQVLPPTRPQMQQLSTICAWFIWQGAIFRVPITTLQRPKVHGGWAMTDIEAKCRYLLFVRMQRMYQEEYAATSVLLRGWSIQDTQQNPPEPSRPSSQPATCYAIRNGTGICNHEYRQGNNATLQTKSLYHYGNIATKE
jgi:hypothetical protein